MVLFLLFGGVVADRLPRHLVLVASGVLAGLSQAAVATLVLTHTATVGGLIGLSVVNGMVSAFAFPASSALVSQTVPAAIRQSANTINRLGSNAGMIIGASIGGLLVAGLGSGWGLAADAASFFLSAGLFALVRVPDHRAPRTDLTERTSTLHELRVGWREFVGHTWVWVVVLGFCFLNAASNGGFNVLGPSVADTTFGRTGWGFILAAETAGMVAGAFVALKLRVRRLLLLGIVCCIPEALLLVALAVAPAVVVLVPVAFLTGLTIEQFGIAWEVSLQEHIPADKLARVYSYDALGSVLAIPVGQVVAGPAAAAIGVTPTLLIAAGVAALSVVGMLASRSVRGLTHQAPPADPAPPATPAASVAAPVGQETMIG
jgi:MFS family permease